MTALDDIHNASISAAFGTVNTELPAAAELSDGIGSPTSPIAGAVELRFNEAVGVERLRSNVEATLLTLAARTTDTNSVDQVNRNGIGVMIFIDVTANASAAGVTFRIQGKDPVSGKYFELLASAAVTTVTTVQMVVYPGLVTLANVHASKILPRTWRVVADHGDASSVTYSIGASVAS